MFLGGIHAEVWVPFDNPAERLLKKYKHNIQRRTISELTKASVEFDKNSNEGVVNIKLSTELLEYQDRLALTAKFKEEVEPVLIEQGFWSNLFKVTGVPTYNSGHKWLEFELDLLRVNKPLEWSEEHYKDQITCQVRHLCRFVKYSVDSIEEGFLWDKLPEVSKTIQFVKV